MKWIGLSVLAIVILVVALFSWLSASSRQASAPGRVNNTLTPCPSTPNCVCSEAGGDAEHSIDALEGAALDMGRIADAIQSIGGIIDIQQPDYLSARFVSSLFRFIDDVEVRAAGDGVFHVRSASRAGKSDLGANRKRIELLRAALDK